MRKKFLFASIQLVLTFAFFPLAEAQPGFYDDLYKFSPLDYLWMNVGNPEFSAGEAYYPSLAIHPSGEPYVAYQDMANSGKATVMKFNGSNWVNVGNAGFSAGACDFTNLSFSPSGSLYIAFEDNGHSNKATVMRFDGNNWVNVGNAGFSNGESNYLSFAFGPAGEPYVAYRDYIFQISQKATVMKFDGSNWVNVGSAGFSAGAVASTSLAFSPSGDPYVAFQDEANSGKVTVMKFDGANWVIVGLAGFSAGQAVYVSLAFDLTGQPYVAYEDWGNLQKATVMKFDGTNWVNVGQPGFSDGEVQYTSLAFSSAGQPYVAFQGTVNSWKATLMKYDGINWVNVGSAGFSAGDVANTCLAFSPTDVPYVVYQDWWEHLFKATVMKYDSVFVGIDESQRSQLYLYPNPASKSITIGLKSIPGNIRCIEITDLTGRIMYETKSSESYISVYLENYPAGVYIVKLNSGNSIFTGKFCKN